jgi:hypothetical protein
MITTQQNPVLYTAAWTTCTALTTPNTPLIMTAAASEG